MFTRAIRYNLGSDEQEAVKIYNERAKPMWGKQQGFHSMQRYRIVEGPHKDKQMVVVRFNDQDCFNKAQEAVAQEREGIVKDLEKAGVQAEEVLMLEEVP